MIALVTTANTVDEWRIVTNQLIIQSDGTLGAFDQANTVYSQSNTARNHANASFLQANTAYDRGNTAYDHANNAYARANNANLVPVGNTTGGAFTVRSTRNKLNFIQGSNITINVDDYSAGDAANITITSTAVATGDPVGAYNQANTASDHANAAYGQANTARVHANSAYGQANSSTTQATTARDHANAAFAKANTANNIAVGNTSGTTFTQRSARERLNFIPGTNITINVDDDSSGNRVNVTITSTAADGVVASQAFDQANTARTHANAAFGQANTGTTQATTARDHANNAYAKANAALANTTTTLSGTLTVTGNVIAGNVRPATGGAYIFPNGNVITNFTVSTAAPSGGVNGDIWLKIV